jgi:hypothetical protein
MYQIIVPAIFRPEQRKPELSISYFTDLCKPFRIELQFASLPEDIDLMGFPNASIIKLANPGFYIPIYICLFAHNFKEKIMKRKQISLHFLGDPSIL